MKEPYLASFHDVVAPVVRGAAVAPLSDGVGRADALACVGVTVVPHMAAVTGWSRGRGGGRRGETGVREGDERRGEGGGSGEERRG